MVYTASQSNINKISYTFFQSDRARRFNISLYICLSLLNTIQVNVGHEGIVDFVKAFINLFT